VFDTGPFRLIGETTIPLTQTIKDPKSKSC